MSILVYRRQKIRELYNTKLSENFDLSEFVRTSTGLDNIPDESDVKNIRYLVQAVLQPLRTSLQRPVVVTSGYRSPSVNKVIGGVDHSQHLTGEAADITVTGLSPTQLLAEVRALRLPVDQAIDEQFDGKAWLHVSASRKSQRNQFLAARKINGVLTYSQVA